MKKIYVDNNLTIFADRNELQIHKEGIIISKLPWKFFFRFNLSGKEATLAFMLMLFSMGFSHSLKLNDILLRWAKKHANEHIKFWD